MKQCVYIYFRKGEKPRGRAEAIGCNMLVDIDYLPLNRDLPSSWVCPSNIYHHSIS